MTETHLKAGIKDEEIAIQGYLIMREDRLHKGGGGCVVYYREDLEIMPKTYNWKYIRIHLV